MRIGGQDTDCLRKQEMNVQTRSFEAATKINSKKQCWALFCFVKNQLVDKYGRKEPRFEGGINEKTEKAVQNTKTSLKKTFEDRKLKWQCKTKETHWITKVLARVPCGRTWEPQCYFICRIHGHRAPYWRCFKKPRCTK